LPGRSPGQLAARLSELEDGRRGAERELTRIRNARTEIETFEADAAALLAYYERVTPEHIDALSPEQRHHVYRTIRLEALAHPYGLIEVTGDVLLDVSTIEVTHAREEILKSASGLDYLWRLGDDSPVGGLRRAARGSLHGYLSLPFLIAEVLPEALVQGVAH
jgi:hypothetical protein